MTLAKKRIMDKITDLYNKSLKNIIEKWEITTSPKVVKTELVTIYVYPEYVAFIFGIEDKNYDIRNTSEIMINKSDGKVILATEHLGLLEKQYQLLRKVIIHII